MSDEARAPVSSRRADGRWLYFGKPMIEQSDALPCPICGDDDPEFNANVVICVECGFRGPDHGIDKETGRHLPEFMCDWREAIEGWNNAPERHLSEPWKLA